MNNRTARFWVYVNSGIAVRIKLRRGQTVSYVEGGETDEGYDYTVRTWTFTGEEVLVSWVRHASDCDGRMSSDGFSTCAVDDLTMGYVCPDDEPFARNGVLLHVQYPKWRDHKSSQRDYAAEAAGY